jgi:hypothetical protein
MANETSPVVDDQDHLYIDGKILCTGVRNATSRSEEPILCLIRSDTVTFVAVSGLRMVISWKTQLRRPAPRNVVMVIPPLIAELLSCETICSQVGVELVTRGDDAFARLTDHLGSYDIHWKSNVALFPAPDSFGRLIKEPGVLVEVPHLRFSDATHQAVAKLVQMEAEEQINPTKLAILIDLDFGRLRVEGEEIVSTGRHQYYFDPRLVIRALEFLKEKTIHVGITPLKGDRQGFLSLLSEQDGWTIHCALLSIGMDTQKLYPLPPGRNR